jgi:sialic acid synthase SpsE
MLEHIIKDKVFIVAEIGKNFIRTEEDRPISEYLENAKQLVAAAKEAGADAVKFQTHHSEDEILPIEFDSPHFKGQSRYRWVVRNTNATPIEEFWKPLKAYCASVGIIFFSTPMSRGAAMKLERLSVPFWKVGSADILDFVMLDFMVATGKTIIVPTGMSTPEEVDTVIAFLRRKNAPFVLMHAISRYPYPAEDSNLLTLEFFRKRYPGVTIGFSQNSPWVEPAVCAVALGARIVEQHFTLDRNWWGPDHKVSMKPDEFRHMVVHIRAVEESPSFRARILLDHSLHRYFGTEDKFLQEGEVPFRSIFRKSLVAAADLPAGAAIIPSMLYAMRPQQAGQALSSESYEEIIGKRLQRPVKKYGVISEEMLTAVA